MTEISVVIPTYNEEERIGESLKSVLAYLAKNFKVFEVIVVDDGSCDHTLQEVKKYSQVKILKNLVNHGKGYTVKKGVLASRGELILFMDADSSTDIVELIKYILGLKINDTQCGFKLFQAKTKYLFEQLSISSWGFDFELLFLAKIFHYPVKEVPVVWFNHAGSRVTALAYLQTLAQVFQVRINYLLNKYFSAGWSWFYRFASM